MAAAYVDQGSSGGHSAAVPASGGLVRVIEFDDELAADLDEGQRALATRFAVAPAVELERGPWEFFPPPEPGALGALVLAGTIVIRIQTGERAHLELLGEGDVVSPWVSPRERENLSSVDRRLSAESLTDVRIALLNRKFALLTSRWPEIHAALMHKLIVRSRRLSLQAAINSLPRIEERLELTLWRLADRFGYVTPKGVGLRLALKHVQLSEMVAAQRPSVSTALSRLEDRGRVVRLTRGHWLLCGSPPPILTALARETGL